MPGCCAYGCSSRWDKGFKVFSFPSDPERRKVWMNKVNREGWEPTSSSVLCEVHFEYDQFENRRADGKRKLKWNAVPTIFSHRSIPKRRKVPAKRSLPEPQKIDLPDHAYFKVQQNNVLNACRLKSSPKGGGYADEPIIVKVQRQQGTHSAPGVAGASTDSGNPTVQRHQVTMSTPASAANSQEVQDPGEEAEQGWSVPATLLLIETFKHHRDELCNGRRKKYLIWQDIAKKLQEKGHSVEGIACDTKMRALKRRYRLIKHNNKLRGREATKQWFFFNTMDELLADDHVVVPVIPKSCYPVSSPVRSPGWHSPSYDSSGTNTAVSPYDSPVQSPCGDSSPLSPSVKRARKRRKCDSAGLDNLISSSSNRNTAINELKSIFNEKASSLEIRRVQQKEIKELRQQWVEQQEKHQKEVQELQQKLWELEKEHKNEMREQVQQHKTEMKELLQKTLEKEGKEKTEMKELQKKMWDQEQQHKIEMKELQKEMRDQQQHHIAQMGALQERMWEDTKQCREEMRQYRDEMRQYRDEMRHMRELVKAASINEQNT